MQETENKPLVQKSTPQTSKVNYKGLEKEDIAIAERLQKLKDARKKGKALQRVYNTY